MLDLEFNDFFGQLLSTFGLSLPNLLELFLYSNKLSGAIPSSMNNASSLTDLDIIENSFTGSVSNLGNLGLLKTLYLGGNDLTGEYPNKELGFLSSLTSYRNLWKTDLSSNPLNASGCGIRGSIPVEIENLTNFVDLSLDSNRLIGFIPRTVGKLKGLGRISLHYNKLQGLIPGDLCLFSKLGPLYLNHNKLQGPILNALVNLNPSKNCTWTLISWIPVYPPIGSFPSGIENFKIISKFDLSFNSFSGHVPGDIYTVVSLDYLSLAHNKFQGSIPQSIGNLKRSSYMELVKAANDFSDSNKLGRGSTGTVLIGMLSDGLMVAIKVFNLQFEKISRSFDTEVEVLRTIRHRNLIKVIGCCCNQDFKALVLEYMPNGSLDKWLHSHYYFLGLLQRLNIAMDIALALEYLHQRHMFPIVHCELKPSNVLLDEDMTAHVGDFGIAKLLGEGELIVHTTTLMIRFALDLSAKYRAHDMVSSSGDIYSFGIMLLEICTRKKTIDERFGEEISLKSWVNFSLQENRISEVMDTNLQGRKGQNLSAMEQFLLSMLCLAMECLATSPSDRINISDDVSKLERIRSMF
ncbi:Serine/threonine protein kinase [Handroanthus impetiginosus]|uniref:non-specific serine/threonine protein kinase n=1 Tax=Handroanthus impetiginosus TaxID=429701 RepID=A0A2G9GMN5_9LAMI|nr:Serine/threonine protein kinase [Handroanthus impetiginosus]